MLARLKLLFGLTSSPDENSGARGEAAAAEFLRREQGFAIVARNWRNPRDRREEIDLVARDGEVLVFVEVKTRAAGALVSGFHSVNARKKAVLRRAATAYLRTLGSPPVTFRLDIVEVAFAASGAAEVRHFSNVRLFPKQFQP
jgi:putative endonuclease